jgi:hypothetical protein
MNCDYKWLLLLVALAWPETAEAHAFAERYDLPLPLWHYLAGAGATVLLTFLAAAFFLRLPAGEPFGAAPAPAARRPSPGWLGGFSVALFVLLLAAGLVGRQNALENILPTTVWVIWWVGMTYVSALFGNLWPAIDPWRIVAEWVAVRAHRPKPPGVLPEAWGIWPGVLLLLAVVWAELAWHDNAVPWKLSSALIGYSLLTWIAMALFGVEEWLKRGEVFTLFFGLIARFAPVDVETRRLRWPGAGLVQSVPAYASETAFVLLALATVSFDGIRETPLWQEASDTVFALAYRAGILGLLGTAVTTGLIKSLGLLATALLFAGAYLAVCGVTARLVVGTTTGEIARRFVLSLLPIAVGYHVAHYLSFLIINGQRIIPLASDPLGRGWNLLGTASYVFDEELVGSEFVWTACLLAIVAGHVAAVLVAHGTALRAFGERGLALRSQYPMLALMVGYTMLSLWILSQPVVR